MTSTNHFRNRRLGGSQRALISKGCDCPPATTAPPANQYCELAATGFTDNNINVNNFGPITQQGSFANPPEITFQFNDQGGFDTQVFLTIDTLAQTWTGELWSFDGSAERMVATGAGSFIQGHPTVIDLWGAWTNVGSYQGTVDGWAFIDLP